MISICPAVLTPCPESRGRTSSKAHFAFTLAGMDVGHAWKRSAVTISAVLVLQNVNDSGARGSSQFSPGANPLQLLDGIQLGFLAGGIPR